MFLGILLLLVGLLMLLNRLGMIRGQFWDWLWPAVMIAVGFNMLIKHINKRNTN